MDGGDSAEIGGEVSQNYSGMNKNSNNVISEQDVKLSFGFEEPEQQNKDLSDLNTAKASPLDLLTRGGHVEDNAEAIVVSKLAIGKNENDENSERREKDKQDWLEQVEEERAEWDALENVQRTSTGKIKSTLEISYNETFQYFKSKTYDKSNITSTVERSGLSALIHWLCGPPKLHGSLVEEKELVFCIAKVQLDDADEVHGRVLQTIYRKLTGAKFDCPRRGSHWETIGFQGNDPATDLRGVGFLGLIQILYAVTNIDVSSLFTDFYRLSLDAEQNYPFCVMSFNITRITMQVLRAGKLHRECNKKKSVFSVLNDFYVAVFLHIHKIWKSQFKTIKDSGIVMADAEHEAMKNTKLLLKNLENTLKEKSSNKKKLPASPVPITGPLMPDERPNLRKLSTASSASGDSTRKSHATSVDTPNSARFVPTKKPTAESDLYRFTDIRLEVKDEPTTDL